jgi:hypothetical protein
MRSDPGRGLVDNDAWEEKRRETANALSKIFFDDATLLRNLNVDMNAPGLWWLAGLTSVADWIGSDESFFPADKTLSVESSHASAVAALGAIVSRITDPDGVYGRIGQIARWDGEVPPQGT